MGDQPAIAAEGRATPSGPRPAGRDRAAVRAEMESVRLDFHQLIGDATPAELRHPTDGTRWTNQQLLFHMLFGYLIVRALLVLVRVFGLLPDGASKAFARLLDSAHRPFDLINYLGSCAGAWVISPMRMTRMLDRVIAALQQHLQRETSPALRHGMHYPTTWDPFFADYMTLADIYHYPTQHFRFHQRQLTLSQPGPPLLRPTGSDRAERPTAAGKSPSRRGAGGRNPAVAASPQATLPVAAEPIVRLTIDIAAPAEVVFGMLADPAQHPKIDGSGTVRHVLRGPRRLSAGSRFRMNMRLFGVPYRVTNRVVEFEPDRLITWRHFEPQRWRYELEPIAGGTRVRESFDYSAYPRIGRWFIRLAGWPERNRRAIAQTLLRLKAAAENRAGGRL
jgi:uncharacterized protein YndB with AHSA1/START domain